MLLASLILIALGSAALVVLRDARFVLGGLVVQWLGLAWMAAVEPSSGAPLVAVAGEVVTALVCGAMLALTLVNLQEFQPEQAPGQASTGRGTLRRGSASPRAIDPTEQLLHLVIALAGGVAGFGLAQIYPLGTSQESLLAFFWVVLSAILVLVLDGARDPVKHASGLLALLNGVALLVHVGGATSPGLVLLALLAISRIALTGVLAYGWALLKVLFSNLNFGPLFDTRRGLPTTGLVVSEATGPVAEEPAPSASAEEIPEETEIAGEEGSRAIEQETSEQASEEATVPSETAGEEPGAGE